MKKELLVQAPENRLLVKELSVKMNKKTDLILTDETAKTMAKELYDYQKLQWEVIGVGKKENGEDSIYSVGDIIIGGRTPTPENVFVWGKVLYAAIRFSDVLGWIPKSAKSKVQHIYNK